MPTSSPPQALARCPDPPLGHHTTGGTDLTFAAKTVLVTGANRGIGQALIAEALSRGAMRVYAGTRQPLAHPDPRVTPLTLDVTDQAQIQAAAEQVESLDVLVNNAGIWLFDDLSDRAMLEEHLAVNLFGTWGLTQSLRALLAGRGVRVHAVLTGPVDTDMTRGFDIPKASPQQVAHAIWDGVEAGRRRSSPIPRRRRWPRAGVAGWPRRSSARTPRSPKRRSPKQRVSGHRQGPTLVAQQPALPAPERTRTKETSRDDRAQGGRPPGVAGRS
jgi:NAD(P)-dependent dehydrogenase (short-subunit alcohol dehydrogenase family)